MSELKWAQSKSDVVVHTCALLALRSQGLVERHKFRVDSLIHKVSFKIAGATFFLSCKNSGNEETYRKMGQNI